MNRSKWYLYQLEKKVEIDHVGQIILLGYLSQMDQILKSKGALFRLLKSIKLSGNPISAESCLQHAEHYQRIIEANELKSQKNQIDQSAEPNTNNEELKSENISDQEVAEVVTQPDERVERPDIISPKLEEQVIGK